MKYKITVILPVHNGEISLETALKSLINQTMNFNDMELIIINDASEDGSNKIIESYKNKYDNIKSINLDKTLGLPGRPRTIGMKYATTNYIMYLDADDEYLPNGIELLYKTIKEENSDFVMGTHYHSINGRNFISNLFTNINENININPKNQKEFDLVSKIRFVAPWGKIFKKQFLIDNELYFPEDSLCEDSYFYYKALLNANKVTYIPQTPVYIYKTYENKKSAIHGHDLKKFNNFIKGMEYMKILFEKYELNESIAMSEHLEGLLLIFSNLTKKEKKIVIEKIYNFEKKLNCNIIINKKEINLLNNQIKNKNFKKAIFISNFYKSLYNNRQIKHLYRMWINKLK